MNSTIDPQAVAAAVMRAAACRSQPVGVFAESSSAMFYGTRALCELPGDSVPYYRMSTHYGSMGHALAGAIGFCAATGGRGLVLTGDGSFHLMNPLPVAVKHGFQIAVVVLNDARLGLPHLGTLRVGAHHAHATTSLASWDFTRQGSSSIGGRRASNARELDEALASALSFDGCFVVDAAIDPLVVPPVGARLASVDDMFGGQRG